MNKQEAMDFITSTNWKGSSLGLARMKQLMDNVGNPQNDLHFIHVAGTNGKGSCCAMLNQILITSGYRTGMYTSPHLINYEERFIVNNHQINEEDFCEAAEAVKKAADKMDDKPTEFEIMTAMAFYYFRKAGCDVVVLEVGLGGRLDATNVIENPDLCVIMNIGLEHTEILGDTIAKIAFEKAGIIKPGCDVVAYESEEEAINVFREVCKERNAYLTVADFSKISPVTEDIDHQVFNYGHFRNVEIALLGPHQLKNAATVIEAVKILRNKGYDISWKNLKSGLKKTSWPARLSVLSKKPLFILDGAHNPQCAEALVSSLPAILKDRKAVFLTGMLRDKDYHSVMEMMSPFASEFVCLTPLSPRALTSDQLAEHLEQMGQKATACHDITEGISTALSKAGRDGIIICFGSLYLAGAIQEHFAEAFSEVSL